MCMSCNGVRAVLVFVNSVKCHLSSISLLPVKCVCVCLLEDSGGVFLWPFFYLFIFEHPSGWRTAGVSGHVCVSPAFSISTFSHGFIDQSLRSSLTTFSSSFLTFTHLTVTNDGQSEYEKTTNSALLFKQSGHQVYNLTAPEHLLRPS